MTISYWRLLISSMAAQPRAAEGWVQVRSPRETFRWTTPFFDLQFVDIKKKKKKSRSSSSNSRNQKSGDNVIVGRGGRSRSRSRDGGGGKCQKSRVVVMLEFGKPSLVAGVLFRCKSQKLL